jgi:hypothetical protein
MKTPMSRRALLRGTGGVAIALPFLDAMRPRKASAQTAAPRKMLTFLIENGVVPSAWFPNGGTEKAFTMGSILKPLEPHQKNVIMVDGLDSKTSGGTCHSAARCGALTGCNNNGGRANGISIDQAVANMLPSGRLKSIEASVFLKNNFIYSLFHSGPGQMVTPIDDPALVFARLFSDGVPPPKGMVDNPAAGADFAALRGRRKSILDRALNEYTRVQGSLGAADKTRLDRHMAGIREIERSLATEGGATMGAGASCKLPAMPAPGGDFPTHTRLQSDLTMMALACGITNVVSIQTRASLTSFTWLGVNTGQHALSHQQGSPGADAQLNKIATWFSEQVAYIVTRLKALQDSDGRSVFDNTLVFYTNDLGRGTHARQRYPFLLATGDFKMADGKTLETGRYLKYPSGTPHNDLLASIAKIMGNTSQGKFGNYGSGPLPGLA